MKLTFSVSAEELSRVLSNAMKFTNPKSLWLPGEILLSFSEGVLRVYSSDDYIFICDAAEYRATEEAEATFVLSLEDVKELEKTCRDYKKYDINIVPEESSVSFVVGEGVNSSIYEKARFTESAWDKVDAIIFDEYFPAELNFFCLRDERLTKLSQLKKDKEAPISFGFYQIGERVIIRFKAGETLRGAIQPVNPSYVDNNFLLEYDE